MTKHLMLDCESLDIAPTAAILSIGAVVMDMNTFTLEDQFYATIDLQNSLDHGATFSADTIKWWAKQKPQAFVDAMKGENTLLHGLHLLDNFYRATEVEAVWACGSRDFEWIEHSCKLVGRAGVPWSYNKAYDYRPIRDVFGHLVIPPDPIGNSHNALDDAMWQATHLMSILKLIGGTYALNY